MTANNPAAAAHFGRLDAIRGLAILWVFLYHFGGAVWGWDTGKWPSGWGNMPAGLSIVGPVMAKVFSMGALGVPIFFVLSGFLIHYTYSRSADQRVSVFWFRRWGRIYPPYLVALVAFTLWRGVLWKARGGGNFVTHLFLVHNFSDRYLFGINGSFWSLAHEAQFYALYPLLFLLRRKIGMMPLLYGSLAMRLIISVWIKLTPGQFSDDPAFVLMLPRLYFEWILGMYVAIWLLGFSLATLVTTLLYLKTNREPWPLSVALSLAGSAFVFGLFERGLGVPFPPARILVWLGLVT